MSFIDNSGSLILTAVLTDAGRERLARGDGSFKVVKFALSDDEIDYSNYDLDNANGSAYYAIQILQTPVLEASTNNTSSFKSRLISNPNPNLLYLPVLKLNQLVGLSRGSQPIFYLASDEETEQALNANASVQGDGVSYGENTATGLPFVLDQGLDTQEISSKIAIDENLIETQYTVKIDNRLGKIANPGNGTQASLNFIDDDEIANYFFALNTDTAHVQRINETSASGQVIAGPRGTRFSFKISSSIELGSNDYLFNLLGGEITLSSEVFKYIDSSIRIEGNTTGYSVDLPIRFMKKV